MGQNNSPITPGNQPSQGQTPGASGPASQGPNDPLQSPPTQGGGQQSDRDAATDGGDPRSVETRLSTMEANMRRMGEERDTARRELEEERRKGLPPEEVSRLKALDDQVKAQSVREKNLILRYEIASRAPRLGIIDPEVAVLLLERSSAVTVSDDGSVTGLDDALKQLIKDKPHLIKVTSQPIDGGAGSSGPRTGPKRSMNDFIRGAARGTTSE